MCQASPRARVCQCVLVACDVFSACVFSRVQCVCVRVKGAISRSGMCQARACVHVVCEWCARACVFRVFDMCACECVCVRLCMRMYVWHVDYFHRISRKISVNSIFCKCKLCTMIATL